MNAVAYLRVSSREQAERDTPIAGQRSAIHRFAHQHGYTLVGEFVDGGESGRTDARTEFQAMLRRAQAKDRPFDAVLVWKFDRFARNADDAAVHKAVLRRAGVRVVSITEPVTDDPMGKFLERQYDAMAELFSAMQAENIRRGLRENAQQGGRNGGQVPFGYRQERQDGRSRLVVHDDEAAVVRKVFRWCAEGLGIMAIARRLNAEGHRTRAGQPFGRGSLYPALLTSPVYTGVFLWERDGDDPVRIPDAHPAIIDADLFDRAQAAMRQRATRRGEPATRPAHYLLTGVLYCTRCGDRMWATLRPRTGEAVYYCRHRRPCDHPRIACAVLDTAVFDLLRSYLETPAHLNALVRAVNVELASDDPTPRLKQISRHAATLARRRERLLDAVEHGTLKMEEVSARLDAVREESAALDQERQRLLYALEQQPGKLDAETVRRALHILVAEPNRIDPADRRAAVRPYVARVDAHFPTATVTLGFGGVKGAGATVDLRGPCPVTQEEMNNADAYTVRQMAAQVRTWAKDTAFPAVRLNSMRRAELLDYARGLLCPIKNGMS